MIHSPSHTESVQFETPENITVRYPLAGPGTRFTAWVYDVLILYVPILVVTLAAGFWGGLDDIGPQASLGLLILVFGFAPLVYFGLFEYLHNGQTPGKEYTCCRVVAADGFRLTLSAALVRSVFRIVDSLPILWVVPLVSSRHQRLGDMVAGTIVIREESPDSIEYQAAVLRRRVNGRTPFTHAQLCALDPSVYEGVGELLQRAPRLTVGDVEYLAGKLAAAVCARMERQVPESGQCLRFLEDLYASHLEREFRELG
jgi:uncharacterized RDD family membrane protein YckC